MIPDSATSDLGIARQVTLRPISDVAADLNLTVDDLEFYGRKPKLYR